MNRSQFVLAKDCSWVTPEIRNVCCSSLMFHIDDHSAASCEKYGNRTELIGYDNVFKKKFEGLYLLQT